MTGPSQVPRRWAWLVLSALVAAVAVGALFALNDRENEARANEQVVRRYIARLDQTISELTPLGGFLSERNPKLLSRLIQTATEVGRSDRLAVQQVDRARAMQIERLLDELITEAADDNTNLIRAAVLTGQARALADEIANHEERRADQASRLSLYGSALVVLLALGSVGWLVARERRLSLRAARLHADELQHLADHDGLTGLLNRRALEAELLRIAKAPQGDQVEIAVCDLDGLKLINDRDGHHEGDRLIIRAADALRCAVAGRGTVYRTGGDEFCVIAKPGMAIAAAVRDALDGAPPSPSGSVGTARWPHDASDLEEVIRLADVRMYAAKHAQPGRRDPVRAAR